jgi:hypothetical protein
MASSSWAAEGRTRHLASPLHRGGHCCREGITAEMDIRSFDLLGNAECPPTCKNRVVITRSVAYPLANVKRAWSLPGGIAAEYLPGWLADRGT